MMKIKIMNVIIVAMLLVTCTFMLSGCGKEKMSEQAKSVYDMIAELPEQYSAEADEAIQTARTAYDALSEEEKNTVDISALSNLEQAKYQAQADEINSMIDSVKVSNTSFSELSNAKASVSKVMGKIVDLPSDTDKLINYDELLKKINDISDEYTDTMLNADNDINAMNDIMTKLNYINSSYSASSKYGYACDIASDVSKLSDHLSSVRSKLYTPASDLKDACLYGDDFDISLAVLDIIQDFPEDSCSFYTPYLNATGFVDDCLKWQQIVQEKIDSKKAVQTSESKTD